MTRVIVVLKRLKNTIKIAKGKRRGFLKISQTISSFVSTWSFLNYTIPIEILLPFTYH